MGTSHHVNSTEVNSIQAAISKCQAKGGQIASIRSEDDQQCLVAVTQQSTQPLWIGLYEIQERDPATNNLSYSWVWRADEGRDPPVTYKNWDIGSSPPKS